MTHKGKVYIGADSLGSNGFTQSIRKESKVFKNGEFLIGCTSSFRMIDLLKWKFNPPTLKMITCINLWLLSLLTLFVNCL